MKPHELWLLIPFALVCFIQNMTFTWSSRSRQSGDPNYHRMVAWSSNGVYFITNALLTIYIIKNITGIFALALSGLVYTLATAEGSSYMMRLLLKSKIEDGKRAVGARP